MMLFELLQHIDRHSEEYKIAFLNVFALGVSFTNVKDILQIILLAVSIVYTVYKVIEIKDNRKNKPKK
jgi:hypothetical protein